jgi:ribonuclease PH
MSLAINKLRASGALTQNPVRASVAAVSVGIIGGVPIMDLNYQEDSSADVDFNLVMTDKDEFVEIQGTAERNPFDSSKLNELLDLGRQGIQQLIRLQRETLGL